MQGQEFCANFEKLTENGLAEEKTHKTDFDKRHGM